MEGQRKSEPLTKHTTVLPEGVKEKAQKFEINNNLSQSENISNFTNTLTLNELEIKNIEQETKDQSKSNDWFIQRAGRITASKFSKIYTKMETLKQNPNKCSLKLVESILSEEKIDTFSTRHGIGMEFHAKVAVITALKNMGHKKVKSFESGTIIDKEHPYISAPPDLFIECLCCGKALVEIKCPYSIRDSAPSKSNLKQLETLNNGEVKLKLNHPHYFQIQGQLGITSLKNCWYFVYTDHGHYIENILFSNEFYQNILKNLKEFWYKHLAKYLLFGKQNIMVSSIQTGEILKNPLISTSPLKKKKRSRACLIQFNYYMCKRSTRTKTVVCYGYYLDDF